jgi:hypothetical protein
VRTRSVTNTVVCWMSRVAKLAGQVTPTAAVGALASSLAAAWGVVRRWRLERWRCFARRRRPSRSSRAPSAGAKMPPATRCYFGHVRRRDHRVMHNAAAASIAIAGSSARGDPAFLTHLRAMRFPTSSLRALRADICLPRPCARIAAYSTGPSKVPLLLTPEAYKQLPKASMAGTGCYPDVDPLTLSPRSSRSTARGTCPTRLAAPLPSSSLGPACPMRGALTWTRWPSLSRPRIR